MMQAAKSTEPAPDELRDLAERGLQIAQDNVRRSKGLNIDPVFLLRYPDGHTRELTFPENTGDIMNSGDAKDILFAWVRKGVQASGVTAVVLVSDAWASRSTEKAAKLTQKEFDALLDKHGTEELAKMGYLERHEVLVACAQDNDRVLVLEQFYGRRFDPDRILWGERREQAGPQKTFRGRHKMFGDLREENLR